jgi:hypothetical protein
MAAPPTDLGSIYIQLGSRSAIPDGSPAVIQERGTARWPGSVGTLEPAARTPTSGVPRVTARPVDGRHTIFKFGRNDSSWGFLILSNRRIDPESQATDRSTLCPMPGGRSQAASECPRTEAVLLRQLSLSNRRAPASSVDSASALFRLLIAGDQGAGPPARPFLLRSMTANDVNRHGNSKPRASLLESA